MQILTSTRSGIELSFLKIYLVPKEMKFFQITCHALQHDNQLFVLKDVTEGLFEKFITHKMQNLCTSLATRSRRMLNSVKSIEKALTYLEMSSVDSVRESDCVSTIDNNLASLATKVKDLYFNAVFSEAQNSSTHAVSSVRREAGKLIEKL